MDSSFKSFPSTEHGTQKVCMRFLFNAWRRQAYFSMSSNIVGVREKCCLMWGTCKALNGVLIAKQYIFNSVYFKSDKNFPMHINFLSSTIYHSIFCMPNWIIDAFQPFGTHDSKYKIDVNGSNYLKWNSTFFYE